jgi:hypothetical protein
MTFGYRIDAIDAAGKIMCSIAQDFRFDAELCCAA